ncbi:MAG: hypothetical protein JWN14_430 [Chthonomonadales bacterium]|nr:hypothetical protein [Chthonomonadales bacterium]
MLSESDTLTARLERLEQDNAQMKTQFHTAQRRLRVQAALAFFAFLLAVFASPVNRTAIAQGTGVTLASLYTSVTNLEGRMKAVESTNKLQDGRLDELQTRIAGIPSGPQGPAGTPADMTRVTVLEAKTRYMSVDTKVRSTTFSGCNVIINDGGGTTATIVTNGAGEGLGNLIIGYNALGNTFYSDQRTGSHNLILGDYNNYSSYGGVVFGQSNTISGPFAVVSGGFANIASGANGSVNGGVFNTAYGNCSSISGGNTNTAFGSYSSVSGGNTNTAGGNGSSVSGGMNNMATGNYSSVNGGQFNTVTGDSSSVSGGYQVFLFNPNAWAAGYMGTYHSP